MKFLLKTLTIIGLINIANSSNLQNNNLQNINITSLQGTNNNLQNIPNPINEQSNVQQNQYLQNKMYRDDVENKEDSESQEQYEFQEQSESQEQSKSQDQDDSKLSSSNDDNNTSFHPSQDIINNQEMLNKYPILKLIKDDDINVQNMTVKELCEKIIQCKNNIYKAFTSIIDKDTCNVLENIGDGKNLIRTLLWTSCRLTFPFDYLYGKLPDNELLSNINENIGTIYYYVDDNFDYVDDDFDDDFNEIHLTCAIITNSLDLICNYLKEIPEKYLDMTVEQFTKTIEQSCNQDNKSK